MSGSGERIQKPLGPLAVTRPATSWTPGLGRSVIYIDLYIKSNLLTSSVQRRQESVTIDGRNGDSGCTRRGQSCEERLQERHCRGLVCWFSLFILELDIPNTYIQHFSGVLPNSSSHTGY